MGTPLVLGGLALLAVVFVRVEGADGAFHGAILRRRLAPWRAEFLQAGMRFPVMFREKRPAKVKIARGEPKARAQRFFDHVRVRDGLIDGATLRADNRGEPAAAVVGFVRPTGRTPGGLPEFDVALRIRPRRGGDFDVIKTMPLLAVERAALQTGRVVPARYVPGEPDAVAVLMRPVPSEEPAG